MSMKMWVIKSSGRYVANRNLTINYLTNTPEKAKLFSCRRDAASECDRPFGEKVVAVEVTIKEFRT
jgi:hypothetical protein